MSGKDKIKGLNQKNVYLTAEGNCTSKNLIYHAACKHCQKVYVGKTTQILSNRINGHRNKFNDCRRNPRKKIKVTEDHLLGLHILYQHGLQEANAFDKSYVFTVLDECSPRSSFDVMHKCATAHYVFILLFVFVLIGSDVVYFPITSSYCCLQ